MEETHYLYVLTNVSNKMQYVGVSKNPTARYIEHMTQDTNPGIMRDRTVAEFSLEILNKGSKKYIYQLEEQTINKLNSRYPNGYNLALGGCGGNTGCAAKGSKSAKAKITEEQAFEIRVKHHEGSNFSQLAREYKLSHPTIRSICLGLTWKHVGGPIGSFKSRAETAELRRRVEELLSESKSYKEISEILGISESCAYYYGVPR